MSTTMTRWRGGAPFDWPELSWFPLFAPTIRVEEYTEGDTYVVRAELPGIDPAADVKLSYLDGALRLQVNRADEHKERTRSEFHYGSFTRTVPLPAGAKEKTIAATYEAGVLTVTVQIGEPETGGREIPVKITSGNGKK
jgi:HSP20 family protein